ncbi:MAG: hypothetical protein PUG48_06585 [Clostridia bacterium]|nr:hypothetical protein [Clostridia bacterium]
MVKIGEQADFSGFGVDDESIPTDTENRWDGQPRDSDGRFDKGSKGGKKFRISRKEKSSESPKKSEKGVEKSAESGIINKKDGSYRAEKYQKNWNKASLKEITEKFKLDTVTGPNENGKLVYSSKKSDIIVVFDVNGNYFRIQDKNVDWHKRSAYLDINGKNAQNIEFSGKIRGRTKEEFQRDTHFLNTDNDK